MIILNESIKIIQNYATWIQKGSLVILKLKIFMKTLQMMVKKRVYTSNYEIDRPLLIGINKTMIGFMKDEIGGNIMTKFAVLKPKTYSYFKDDKRVREQKLYNKMKT